MNKTLTLVIPILIFVTSCVFANTEWTYLNRDEKIDRFQATTKGKLNLDGQPIPNFSMQDSAKRIAISPISPDGKYAVVISFGDQDTLSAVLDLQSRSVTPITLEGTPMIWNSWSPDNAYLVMTTYTDSESVLYVIPTASWQPRKIPVRLHQKDQKTELDPISIEWPGGDEFKINATIHCSDCSSREEERVLRSFQVNVTASSGELKTTEVALPSEEM